MKNQSPFPLLYTLQSHAGEVHFNSSYSGTLQRGFSSSSCVLSSSSLHQLFRVVENVLKKGIEFLEFNLKN